MRQATLSVVVPAYNEERRLPALLSVLDSAAERVFGPAALTLKEVVVVDDGSTDGTRRLLESYGGLEGKLRVVALPRNRGKGAAVRAGVLAADAELVLVTDADMSAPLEQIALLAVEIDRGADVALGSRGMAASEILRHQNVFRKRMGKLFNLFFRTLTGLPFHDTQCGFKLFRLEAARRLFALQTIDGFAFDTELCVNATLLELRVVEVPIVWSHSRDTRVKLVRSSSRMAFDLVRVAWRARTARRSEALRPASARVDERA